MAEDCSAGEVVVKEPWSGKWQEAVGLCDLGPVGTVLDPRAVMGPDVMPKLDTEHGRGGFESMLATSARLCEWIVNNARHFVMLLFSVRWGPGYQHFCTGQQQFPADKLRSASGPFYCRVLFHLPVWTKH